MYIVVQKSKNLKIIEIKDIKKYNIFLNIVLF